MKKIITAAASAAMLGGLLLAPSATAAEGECEAIEEAAPVADTGVATIHGESPANAGEGCLVVEGGGAIEVNPLDDGHIGIYDDGGDPAPGVYGSCDGRDADGNFKPLPGEEDPDFTKCSPA